MKLKKFLVSIFIITLIVILISVSYKYFYLKFQKQLYPLPEEYLSCIEKYSEEYNIPKELICGIIHTESSFNPNARSNAGALGIMQITEETFIWLQFKMGVQNQYSVEQLFDYQTNIKFGTYFISLLFDEFKNYDTALAAYNAGRGNVLKWLKDPDISSEGTLINIPFEETSNYIIKVNKAKDKYTELYFSDNVAE